MDKSALALTLPTVLLALLLRVGSVVPVGGVTVAELMIVPMADALTVPLIVMVTLEPAGKVGTNPLTVLPTTETLAGQTAPPRALAQEAITPVMVLGTVSLKLVPLALLGPALLMTRE
jgi:hypothetical protein